MARAQKAPLLRRPVRVAALWNGTLQWEELVTIGRPVALGSAVDALCPLPEGLTDGESLVVLGPQEGGLALQVHPGMSGDVWVGGTRRAVRSLEPGRRLPIGDRDYGVVTFGPLAIFYQSVAGADRIRRKAFGLDRSFLGTLGLAILLHGAALTFMMIAAKNAPPDDETELPLELVRRYMVTPPPQDILEERVELREEPEKAPEKAPEPEKREKPPPRQTVELPRAVSRQVKELAESRTGTATERLATALKARAPTASDFATLTASAAPGTGSSISRTLQSLGTMPGTGTLGFASSGGSDIATVGGPAATKSVGRIEASGGAVRGRVRAVQALSRVEGNLDRGAVLEVINRAISRIQRCYERALTQNPGLTGQVAFTWSIETSGRVGNVSQTSSTLSDASVSTCIAGVLRGLTFPRPTGGAVSVSYPFIFQRAP